MDDRPGIYPGRIFGHGSIDIMGDLRDVLGQSAIEQQNLNREFARPETVATEIMLYVEQIVTSQTATKVEIRGMGSSFIIGDSVYGVLGSDLSPQPYLGANGVTAFTTLVNQTPGSPFINNGLKQLRDVFLGSSAAIQPSNIVLGSGTAVWAATQSGLQYQHGKAAASFYGEGIQLGSYQVTIPSISRTGNGSYTEMGISGGAIFMRDTFPLAFLPANGSELRFTMAFRIGS